MELYVKFSKLRFTIVTDISLEEKLAISCHSGDPLVPNLQTETKRVSF